MEIVNLLDFARREQLRDWLMVNHAISKEAWITINRSKQPREDAIPYVEMVEELLCFGWIDSTLKRLPDGRNAQRISPRRKESHWTKLNIERCTNLLAKGMMTEAGLLVMPQEFSAKVRSQNDIGKDRIIHAKSREIGKNPRR